MYLKLKTLNILLRKREILKKGLLFLSKYKVIQIFFEEIAVSGNLH